MKPDFQRIQSLLREAVTMLCKNSLPYKQELCVEGLLGITLDKEDIFLVNIKEILKPHEIISSVDDSDGGGRLVARERSDDSRLVVEERSLSPANYNQEERDNGESNVECGAVSTRAVVPIFKAPNKVQRSHKRAVSNTELSHHWFTSLTHRGSGDPHTEGWEDGGATPPHNKRHHPAPSHHVNSPAQTIDIDSLPVMEVKKEALDDCVMANYQFHQSADNLSELTNYPSVCRGEAEVKHILPVSLPSIAGLTSSSWHLGSGDVLSTSMPTLPNLSSDMVSAGLPSSHFSNSLVPTERAMPAAAVRPPQPEPAAHHAAAAIILASPGPFHSVRALHRKLQRRVRSSSQLMYVVEGLVRDGLANLVQVVVRPARRSKAVFYKALPPPGDDETATNAFEQRLAHYGVSADLYVDQLRRRDPQIDVFTHTALLREHPDPHRLLHFYRQYEHTESENAALHEPGHQERLSEPVMAMRVEQESETLPEFDRPQLFHKVDTDHRTESETLELAPQQSVALSVLQTQSGAGSYPEHSGAGSFPELHHLERLCTSRAEPRTETESETFPGHTFSCVPHDQAEHETPPHHRQTDSNGLSVPQS